MTSERPRKVFVGSSATYIKLAHAFRMTFQHDSNLEVEVWDITRWRENYDNLTALLGFFDRFQFGVFLLSPDDTVISPATGSERQPAPRDNVVFELGMWFGRAGRDRTWFLVPNNVKVKTPSDLVGLNTIKYKHPTDGEYRDEPISHFQSAFANAHDLVLENIADYQKRAKDRDFFKAHINHLREILKRANEEEQLRIIRDAFGLLLYERAAVARMSLDDTLRDMLLWTQSLLDGLDADQLADEQDAKYTGVWVFAPEPIETLNGIGSAKLKETVVQNIFEKGIHYRYFVDDVAKVGRIKSFLAEASKTKEDNIKTIDDRVSFVVLPEESFLSFFTLHYFTSNFCVYQSIAKDNRDDFIVKLDSGRAARVRSLIEKLTAAHSAVV